MTAKCTVDWCEKPQQARGYCDTHYKRLQRGADLNKPLRKNLQARGVPCQAPLCSRPARTKQLCPTHYKRLQDGIPLDKPLRQMNGPERCSPPVCRVDLVARLREQAKARGLTGPLLLEAILARHFEDELARERSPRGAA